MRESDEQFLERFIIEIEPAVQPLGRVTGARLVEDVVELAFEQRQLVLGQPEAGKMRDVLDVRT